MKKSVGTFEAKTHFTKIISKVMAGEEVIISRRGKNVAKIVQVVPQKTASVFTLKSDVFQNSPKATKYKATFV